MIPKVFQEIKPEYYNPDIIKRPVPLFRYDALDDRYYYEFVRGKGLPYISVTSLSNQVLPKGRHFEQWLIDMGPDATTKRRQTAIFGTIFHIQAMAPFRNDTVHGKGYNYDWLLETDHLGMTNFQLMFPPEYRDECMKWHRSFVKGLHAWFRFVQERVTKIVAIEIPLRSKKMKVAATLDIVFEAMFNGKPRICNTDIKSFLYTEDGNDDEKNYYSAHEFQLEIQKEIWNENFPDIPVTHLFNWSPKNWREEPTYTWKNQTDNRFAKMTSFKGRRMKTIEFYIEIAKAQELFKPPTHFATIVGKFDDISSFNWSDHIYHFKL